MPDQDKQQTGYASQQPVIWMSPPPDDEISLFDLWLILARRKWLLLAVFAACVVVGLALIAWVPAQYAYRGAIEIGQRIGPEGNPVPLESPESVVAKLENAIIPQVVREYVQAHAGAGTGYPISVERPNNTNIIVLRSEAPGDRADAYLQLQAQAFKRVIDSNRSQFQELREYLQSQIQAKQDFLDSLESTRDKLSSAIAGFELDTNSAGSAGDESAMAQITQQQYLANLQTRLTDTSNQINRVQAEITQLTGQINSLQPTEIVLPPSQSLQTVGVGFTIKLALLLILAFFVAIFATYFAEFVSRARQTQTS